MRKLVTILSAAVIAGGILTAQNPATINNSGGGVNNKTTGNKFPAVAETAKSEKSDAPDIALYDYNVYAPASGCDVTSNGVIGATLRNEGTLPVQEFTLTYKVNDNATVSQTFTEEILPGYFEAKTVFFDETFDFSAVGEYKIFLTASTPDDENFDNNETEVTVKNFTPLTELPFECDFTNEVDVENWNSWIFNAWSFVPQQFSYHTRRNFDIQYMVNSLPLISRCITLKPDIYRLSYNYKAGEFLIIFTFYVDFYVAFGKSGTDPYSWEPIKEYNDHFTNEEIVNDEIIVEITEPGEYVFAFFYRIGDNPGPLRIYTTSLNKNNAISSKKTPDLQLLLYPNPANGQLRITNYELQIEKVVVYNAAGQVVQTVVGVNDNSLMINTEKYSPGLYYVQVYTKDGVINSKFVVK